MLLPTLTDFVNLLLSGSIPNDVKDIMFGGLLIALHKSSGGIRPIATGYTWRRIAAKCANSFGILKMSSYLLPIQLGVVIPGGAEAAVHSLRRYINTMDDDEVIVKLDFSNTFNTLQRDTLIETIAKFIPEIYCFIHATYSGESILQFMNRIIRSLERPQQEDPLASLEFCCSNHPLLKRLVAKLRLGFMHDIILAGKSRW